MNGNVDIYSVSLAVVSLRVLVDAGRSLRRAEEERGDSRQHDFVIDRKMTSALSNRRRRV